MTREEAIKILKAISVYECYPKSASEETKEALDMAIEALSEPRTGEWIGVTNGRGGHECSNCHSYASSYMSGDEYLSNYCPNCGARMTP